MNAKMLAPKRGEVGLAKFHHLIGYASFLAGIALMLASFTALYWFAGVIGLPTIARLAVAGAIEVMAASLASSATTARRETGKVDLSAWIGFAFFVSIAAYANIMHVIVALTGDKPIPGLPAGFVITPEFVLAACVFAAACPFGGTFGVHRFGWLRAHGADAEWTDTNEGVLVVEQPARAPKPKRAPQQVEQTRVEQPAARAPEPAPRVESPAARPAPAAASAWREDVRAVFDAMIAEDPHTRPDAPVVAERAGVDKHPATVRGWVKTLWDEHEETRQSDAQPDAPMSARDEVRIADPAEDEMDEAELDDHRARHAANVA